MIALRKNTILHTGLALLTMLGACRPTPTTTSSNQGSQFSGDEVLFTVDGEVVPREEFLYVFEKNAINREESDLKAELDEYLELYINFKLKVMEAEKLGYPERQSFQQEFSQYRDQLAQSYLTDNEATDKLVKEAYQRLQQEVNASHILIQVGDKAPPADTLAAYQKIMDLRRRIVEEGESFGDVAAEASEDPSAERNQGDLGYFSALQMVYPFENAAYTTPVGDVSLPIRTRFGYHLVKVNDRRPSAGKIQVSHIMIRATEGQPESEMEAAKKKIDDIYRQLEEGGNWFELCRQFSEDINTKSRGGILPWFGSGEMVLPFEEAAFALSEAGDVSQPVQTAYGWHIIRLEEKQGLQPFDQLQPELKKRITRDSRSEITQQAFIDRLMKDNQLEENPDVLAQVRLQADSTLMLGTWVAPDDASLLSQTLFSLGGGDAVFEVGDFFSYAVAKQGNSPYQDAGQYMQALYERYREDELLEYEKAHLADKYEDYRYLVKEYRDGILLFQLMDEKIWSQAVSDTAGLRQYFEAHRQDYRWNSRALATILNAADTKILDEAQRFVTLGKYPTALRDQNASYAGVVRIIGDNQRKVLNEAINLLVNDPTSVAAVVAKPSDTDSAGYKSLIQYFTERGIDAARIEVSFDNAAEQGLTLSVWSKRAKAMEGYFNQDSPLNLVVKSGLFEQDDEPVLQQVKWKTSADGTPQRVNWDNRNFAVFIQDIQPGKDKMLSEVRGAVISDYQDHLEKAWLQELRNKYRVQLNDEAWEAVYQAYDLD